MDRPRWAGRRRRGRGHAERRRLQQQIKQLKNKVSSLQTQRPATSPPHESFSEEPPLYLDFAVVRPHPSRNYPGIPGFQDLFEALDDDTLPSHRRWKLEQSFTLHNVGDAGAVVFNYTDSNCNNFLPSPANRVSETKAMLRRECRGLVLKAADGVGNVLVRPLHKFFNIDQIPEVSSDRLQHKQITLVTKKLDGQMVSGVMISEHFQLWTRAGPTEVGMQALRVATEHTGDYERFTAYLRRYNWTPIFEFIGAQSHKKASEGHAAHTCLRKPTVPGRELMLGSESILSPSSSTTHRGSKDSLVNCS